MVGKKREQDIKHELYSQSFYFSESEMKQIAELEVGSILTTQLEPWQVPSRGPDGLEGKMQDELTTLFQDKTYSVKAGEVFNTTVGATFAITRLS